jgi:DNA sulfur modification protein DndC
MGRELDFESLVPEEAISDSSIELQEAIELSEGSLDHALLQSVDAFVITYSGGKDSTTTTILTLEWWKKRSFPVDLHILYSDTRMEIPTLHQQALRFLGFISQSYPEVKVHIVSPEPEESFWYHIIGKGYPPPHSRFRWCTTRLKIFPMNRAIKEIPGKKAVLTGVRFGESDARDKRLLLSCSRGGECGQGVLFEEAKKLNAVYVAPIAFWRECQVWDYLNYIAPSLGYPTATLEEIYGGRDTRFGCWSCTVVQKDRAMERTIASGHENLIPLAEFRVWLWQWTREPQNRMKRKNGLPGKLTLEARKEIYRRLKDVESRTGLELLSLDEDEKIRLMLGLGGP